MTLCLDKVFAIFMVATLLSACVTVPGKPVTMVQEVELDKTDTPTRKAWFEGQRVKVIVSPAEGRDFHEAQAAQLLTLLPNMLARAVDEAGSEVIDRTLNAAVMGEIKNAEFQGADMTGGPAVAHYVVKPGFTNVSVTSVPVSRNILSKLIKKNDPPSYEHSIVVEGHIRVYEIPSMRLIETLQFREEEKEENVTSQLANATARVRELFEKASGRVREPFKNLIAPRGAVVKKGTLEGGAVFEVMMGSEHKLAAKAKVKIFSLVAGLQQLIAEGSVTNNIGARSAWVRLDDPKLEAKIRQGDVAVVQIDDSLLGKFKAW